jgi:hypothetical protein
VSAGQVALSESGRTPGWASGVLAGGAFILEDEELDSLPAVVRRPPEGIQRRSSVRVPRAFAGRLPVQQASRVCWTAPRSASSHQQRRHRCGRGVPAGRRALGADAAALAAGETCHVSIAARAGYSTGRGYGGVRRRTVQRLMCREGERGCNPGDDTTIAGRTGDAITGDATTDRSETRLGARDATGGPTVGECGPRRCAIVSSGGGGHATRERSP